MEEYTYTYIYIYFETIETFIVSIINTQHNIKYAEHKINLEACILSTTYKVFIIICCNFVSCSKNIWNRYV